MNRPEQAIQRAVFQHIRARSMPGVFAFHPFNGGKRSAVEAAIYKGLGARAGLPDIIVFYRGQIFGLELKAAKGRVSPVQRQTLNEMEVAGARTHIVKSLDEALITLESWGILRRNEAWRKAA
jgi:hypothetical protein